MPRPSWWPLPGAQVWTCIAVPTWILGSCNCIEFTGAKANEGPWRFLLAFCDLRISCPDPLRISFPVSRLDTAGWTTPTHAVETMRLRNWPAASTWRRLGSGPTCMMLRSFEDTGRRVLRFACREFYRKARRFVGSPILREALCLASGARLER